MTRFMNEEGTLNAYNITIFEIYPGDRFGYKICAKVYSEDQWCAYRGLTEWSDEEVCSRGEKVPFEVAKYFFSTISIKCANYGDY